MAIFFLEQKNLTSHLLSHYPHLEFNITSYFDNACNFSCHKEVSLAPELCDWLPCWWWKLLDLNPESSSSKELTFCFSVLTWNYTRCNVNCIVRGLLKKYQTKWQISWKAETWMKIWQKQNNSAIENRNKQTQQMDNTHIHRQEHSEK